MDRYEELSIKEIVNRKIIEKADKLKGTNLMKEYEFIRRIHKERKKYTKTGK